MWIHVLKAPYEFSFVNSPLHAGHARLLPPTPGALGSYLYASGLGFLSPIVWTLPSRSDIFIPDKVSNSAGIWAAIAARSPVILLMPAESPLPVDTIVILSTLASGEASARTTSGILVMSL